jgi:hypothetical protein
LLFCELWFEENVASNPINGVLRVDATADRGKRGAGAARRANRETFGELCFVAGALALQQRRWSTC